MGRGEDASGQALAWADELGTAIAERGWILLTGGRALGVMDRASRAAAHGGGTVVGILPGDDVADASEFVDIAIVTGMGSARNNINALSCDVIIACGDPGAGTLSEIALAVKAGRPVVLLYQDTEAMHVLARLLGDRVVGVSTADRAVAEVARIIGARSRRGRHPAVSPRASITRGGRSPGTGSSG